MAYLKIHIASLVYRLTISECTGLYNLPNVFIRTAKTSYTSHHLSPDSQIVESCVGMACLGPHGFAFKHFTPSATIGAK